MRICIYCKEVSTRFIIFCFILDILFYMNPHMRKFSTDPVAIFKLFRVFSWSILNPNKAGFFEGSFTWGKGGQFDPLSPSYFKKDLYNTNITLYNF